MDFQEFFIQVKSNKDDTNQLIKLFKKQYLDTNDSSYLYYLFKFLNRDFVDFDTKNLNYIDIFELSAQKCDIFLNGKNYYELDLNFVKFLSQIDLNICNLMASGMPSYLNNLDGDKYIDLIDLDKLEKETYDLDYLVFISSRFINVNMRVNHFCAKICLKLINEKDFENYIYKPFIDLKLSVRKELPKYKKLSEYDKVLILKKYSSYIYRKQ